MGQYIPDTLVEEIRNRSDIVEIIGSVIPLKKAGANYKGVCPFHQEKTPSFVVSPVKQIFHCFGCGEGGNVFHFLMRKDGLPFHEAVHLVADRYNITIPHTGSAGKKFLGKKEIIAVNERFAHFYHKLLMKNKAGASARDYLKKRGIEDAAAEEFLLGYVPNSEPRDHYQKLTADMPRNLVEKSGLYNFYASGVSNRFSGRLLFPIQDYRGQIIGFGGRSLTDDQQPKYLNSPETPVYNKSGNLFNLHRANEAVREFGYFIVVEGYLDLITAYQAGFKAVVAPLGTALTSGQGKLLKRLSTRATLVFDGDDAGLKAAFRAVELLIEGGMTASVVVLKPGEDPDSVIKNQGKEVFNKLLDQALDEVAFFQHYSGTKYDLSKATGRIQAASELLPIIGKEPNALRKDEFLRRLSEALQLNEEALRAELRKKLNERVKPGRQKVDNVSTSPEMKKFPDERDLTQLLLLFPEEIKPLFLENLVLDYFTDQEWRELLTHILDQSAETLAAPGEFLGSIDSKRLREMASSLLLIEDKEALWQNPAEAFKQLLNEKKRRCNVNKLRNIHQKLTSEKDEAAIKSLILEIERLNKENLLLRKGLQ